MVLDCAGNCAAAEPGAEGELRSFRLRARGRRKGELLGSPSPARRPEGQVAGALRSERRRAGADVGFRSREERRAETTREGWEQQHLDKRRSLGTDASAALNRF